MIEDGMETQELVLPENIGFKNDPLEASPYQEPDLGDAGGNGGLPLGFWIGGIAAVVIAAIGIWLVISSRTEGQTDLTELSQRLERLESRVEILVASVEETSAKVRNAGDIAPLAERVDRFQSEIGVKVDLLSSSVGTLQQQLKKKAAGQTQTSARTTRPKPKSPPATTAATPSSKVKRHSVKKGETLYAISRKYKVSIAQLRKWNSLSTNALRVGQSLIVKGP